MISQSQNEIKNLLSKQLGLTHFKCASALLIASVVAIITPLYHFEYKGKNLDRELNLISFLSGVGCCTYTYIAASKIKEYGGKLTMFNQLEKERFIQEQVILQESYLYQLRQQQLGLNIGYQNQNLVIDVPAQENLENSAQLTAQPAQVSTAQPQDCPYCHSSNTKKNGKYEDGTQRYRCKDCNEDFNLCQELNTTPNSKPSFKLKQTKIKIRRQL